MRRWMWLVLLGTGCSTAGSNHDDLRERASAPLPEADAALRERFAPVLESRASATTGGLRVELPRRARDPMFLADDASRVSVEVTMAGAPDAEARALDNGVAFATGVGSSVLLRRTAFGAEDFVAFDARPPREELRYRITLGDRVAGLRLVENQLEFVDASGAPRLRVLRPEMIDAHGLHQTGTLAVDGCAADTNPAAPWGRPVSPPGASRCELVVRWGAAVGVPLDYPAVVDPGWAATGMMATPRAMHTASLLSNGKVLVAGGFIDGNFQATSGCEIYDPVSATWANTSPLGQARFEHTASVLHDGSVVVTGGDVVGNSNGLATSERYNAATGLWGPQVMMVQPHYSHAATLLADGRVLVAGGFLGPSAEIYNAASDVWSTTDAMASPRSDFALVTIGAKAIAIGGYGGSEALDTSAIFDPQFGTWTAGPMMKDIREDFTATLLPDGKILVAGGYTQNVALATAEVYDAATNAFTATASMASKRWRAAAASLPNNRVLVLGGASDGIPTTEATAEIWDEASGTWTSAGDMLSARWQHTATTLGNGTVLVAGGKLGAPIRLAEIYTPLVGSGSGGASASSSSASASSSSATTSSSGAGGSTSSGSTAASSGGAGQGGSSNAGGNQAAGGGSTGPCPPGRQIACACAGTSETGVQVCKDDGKSYGACTGCPPASTTVAGAGGGNGDTGSSSDSGCGCRIDGADDEPARGAGLVALALGAALRRRRPSRSKR